MKFFDIEFINRHPSGEPISPRAPGTICFVAACSKIVEATLMVAHQLGRHQACPYGPAALGIQFLTGRTRLVKHTG